MVSHVGSDSAVTTSTADYSGFTLTLPGPTAADDLILVIPFFQDNRVILGTSLPEELFNDVTGAGSDRAAACGYKYAGASESNPSATFADEGGGNPDFRGAVLHVFSGVDGTTAPTFSRVGLSDTDDGGNTANPPHTTAEDNSALLLVQIFTSGSGQILTTAGAPAGGYVLGAHSTTEDIEFVTAYLEDAGPAGTKTPGAWQHTLDYTGNLDQWRYTIEIPNGASSGTDHTATPADTATASDAATQAVTASRSSADTATASDAATRITIADRAAADTIAAADTAERTTGSVRTAADTAVLTDAATANVSSTLSRAVGDTLGHTDAADRTTSSSRTSNDQSGHTDATAPASTYERTPTATTTATDAASPAIGHARALADTSTSTSTTSRQHDALRDPTDPHGTSDNATSAITGPGQINRSAADTSTTTDDAQRTTVAGRAAADTTGLVDDNDHTLAAQRTAADTADLTDAATASIATVTGATAADTSTLVDTVVATLTSNRTLSDLSSGTDQAGSVATLLRSPADTATSTDQAQDASTVIPRLNVPHRSGPAVRRHRTGPAVRRHTTGPIQT